MSPKVSEPLDLVRRRAQPKVILITRLTVTAVASYLIALLVPATSARPTLAPLTALLVLQISLYRTMRSAVQRIGSVVGGVTVAVVLASLLGFTWWTLGLAIATALVLGHLLRLGDHVLEVPISAMLILSLPTGVNATARVVETLVGAATGLLAGLILSPLRVQPAKDAIEELGDEMGELFDRMAGGLREDPSHEQAVGWLARARSLGREIGRVERALGDAEDSIRMNPRATGLPHAGLALRTGLETMEHILVSTRGLARSLADGTRGEGEPAYGAAAQEHLAAMFDDLAEAIRAYGRMLRSELAGDTDRFEGELRRSLASAQRHREQIAEILRRLPVGDLAEWSLRGELLVHLDRLLDQLRVEHRASARERWSTRSPVHRLPRSSVREAARGSRVLRARSRRTGARTASVGTAGTRWGRTRADSRRPDERRGPRR